MGTVDKVKERFDEAVSLIKDSFESDLDFCRAKNFRISKRKKDCVQFTVNMLSMDVLFAIMELEEVQNVYFHPSAAPPRQHHDVTASRYRVYVQFISDFIG